MPMPLPALPPTPICQVLLGADLWRDDGAKGQVQTGQALAIRGNRILAVGAQAEILRKYPKARRIDLAGGTLLPGLIEGHAHVAAIGQAKALADLSGCASLEAALTQVRAWTERQSEGWIQGRGWDQNLWPGKAFPTAAALDAITGARPAVLERIDGHALWVNSAALAAAGITATSPDPAGGSILRNGQGQPTGILLDNAADLVSRHLPATSPARLETGLLDGLNQLRQLGFTAVADMGVDSATLAAYRRLERQHRLPIRVFAYLSDTSALLIQELRRPRPLTTGWFQVQGVKFYLDGALGSRGARLLAPYQDAPGQGLWLTDPARIAQNVKATLRAGYQPAIHAIGDAANRAALDLMPNPAVPGAPPVRIEHAQIVTAADAARFGPLGVVASVQPMHCVDDHAWTPARLGDRVDEAFPWRRFLTGGAVLALGSDAPIADPNPFPAMAAAETRQDAGGDPPGGFLPDQRLTRVEALRGFLAGNARALARTDLAVLKPGALADLVWLQAPVLALSPNQLRQQKPARMWVNGIEVKP